MDRAEQVEYQVWENLARLVNDLPEEERQLVYDAMAKFLHDMRHSLGLIFNAQELTRREIENFPEEFRSEEMLEIIRTASDLATKQVEQIAESFCDQIEIENNRYG
jgi:hypothetical protein